MTRPVFFIVLYFLLHSCSSIPPYVDGNTHFLSIPEQPSEEGYFKGHFEIAEIIPIQTSDTFLISDIKRLIRYRDKIILLSSKNNTVFVVNAKNGEIEESIQRIGAGPGESKFILDIAFDEQFQQILIYNDYSKLLFFDLKGQFLSELQVDEIYEEMNWQDGKVFFHNKLEGYSSYPYSLKILNIENKTWEDVGNNRKVDFPIRIQGRQMVRSKQLWFTAPLDFNLFNYEKNYTRTPYELSFLNSEINESLVNMSVSDPQKFFQEVMTKKQIYGINSIRETNDYLIFRSNQEGIFILDKKQDQVYWDQFVEEKTIDMNLTNYFPHEGDDNKIMFILHPDELYRKHKKADLSNIEMLSEVEVDDNPILIFYKQK